MRHRLNSCVYAIQFQFFVILDIVVAVSVAGRIIH